MLKSKSVCIDFYSFCETFSFLSIQKFKKLPLRLFCLPCYGVDIIFSLHRMAFNVGLTIFTLLEFVALLFFTIGTPIDMFQSKDRDCEGNAHCLTLWGLKTKCYSMKYEEKFSYEWFEGCTSRFLNFRLSQAFSILSIYIYFMCFVVGVSLCCCCASCLAQGKLLLGVLTFFGCGTGAAAWGFMATAYNVNQGNDERIIVNELRCNAFKETFSYGSGFILFVMGWCLQSVNILMAVSPW